MNYKIIYLLIIGLFFSQNSSLLASASPSVPKHIDTIQSILSAVGIIFPVLFLKMTDQSNAKSTAMALLIFSASSAFALEKAITIVESMAGQMQTLWAKIRPMVIYASVPLIGLAAIHLFIKDKSALVNQGLRATDIEYLMQTLNSAKEVNQKM